MAFSDFKTISDVQKKYRIKYSEENLIVSQELLPSDSFIKDFEFNKENIDLFASEASRSEIIISPLLREVYKKYYQKYSFWIRKSISYDEILSGTPDYIFSRRSELGKTVLEKPIVIVVEAKRNDFEHGWGQCLAELFASQKINDNFFRGVYGIVTDGNLWQFGKLVADNFIKDSGNFTIDNLPRVYGALENLVQLVEEDDEK
ncbi:MULTISPECIES: hypothetical protein [Okeania]|uniref:hypothetical protein n=1 Tax=Okeania TaxID=1458928 RepID=UPI000F54349A|nr:MULTISPECIES: hypothetical protein [Okeania]NES79397.1 hypothetical protein [Okeania sp. SIO1H4]NET23055.1 hypothetical protein [Okeania sp. SIO1H5]NET97182.1 hypothetical protein [Okeania sp. SIO1H2]RQH16665.1 hypothetical protein D4Z78_20240 [Okeania hirsuta]